MVSSFLQGGLGNQMFQIAAAYALALRNNDKAVFDFDKCFTPLQGFKSTKYQNTLFKKVTNINNFTPSKIYYEPKFSYTEIKYHNNILLNGYFQSEKYFEDFKNEIINLFEFNEDIINELTKFINEINPNNLPTSVIHIRRGDYLLNSEFHPPCSKEYYYEGIDILGKCCYIFISDDINWVKNEFIGENFFYYSGSNEIMDLTLMTLVDNVIISNSSFSWWGAYLNLNKNKKIIAPEKWFGVKGPKDIETLLPNDWIKI
jgi:hypothetical protein